MGRVEGRTAIVTGGAKGMGAATVSLLAAEGARVIAADVDTGPAEDLAGRLGANVLARRLDVRSATDWAEVVREAETAFGPVDILVNNAGIADPAALDDWDVARLQHTLDVNLIGAFNGLKAVTASMRRAGGGSIVNIGSVAAFQGVPRMFGYVVSKWGLRGMTRAAALELGSDGIRVNAVHPGQTRTPMTEGVVFETGNIALGRVGLPEDIARAVLFFASDESQFVTGSEVLVDGGMLAGQADYHGLPR
jgi:3alpha(or 20beta)-hydroxysteroid dehydrogenase